MRRFNIHSGEHSASFRLLLERLSKFFSEMDSIDKSQSRGDGEEQVHSAAQELIIRVGDSETDEEAYEKAAAELEERGRVGTLIKRYTIRELMKEGKPLYPENMVAKERELRKRLKVSQGNFDVTAAELKKRYAASS